MGWAVHGLGPGAHYDPSELGGLPVARFVEALSAEGVGACGDVAEGVDACANVAYVRTTKQGQCNLIQDHCILASRVGRKERGPAMLKHSVKHTSTCAWFSCV